MAEHSIDLTLHVDAHEAEELRQLPEDVRKRWEQLNRTLAQGPALTGTRAQQLQAIAARQQEIAGQVSPQEGWSSQQRREFMTSLREANRVWEQYWRERLQIARQSGANLSQQIRETEQQLQTAQQSGDRTRTLQLQRQALTLRQQQTTQREENRQGRQARAQQQAQVMDMATAAQGLPLTDRTAGLQPQPRPEASAAQSSVPFTAQVQELRRQGRAQQPGMPGARGQRLEDLGSQLEELATRGQQQGFFTPPQQRQFSRTLQESNTLWADYWREREQIAKGGGEEIARQIQETERALREAQHAEDRPRAFQLSQHVAQLWQQQATFDPQVAVQQVRQERAAQRQRQQDVVAAAATLPLAEPVSAERQRRAQERLLREREQEERRQAEALRRIARDERSTREEQARQDRAQREQEREQKRQEQGEARRTQ